MKILIVYATRTGTAAKAAALLAEYFDGAAVFDLSNKLPDPEGYDAVIFGSGIRNGRILPPLRKWLSRYWKKIAPVTKGVFICNAVLDESPEIMKENFSLELRNSSAAVDSFGGELNPRKLRSRELIFMNPAVRKLAAGDSQEFVPCLLPGQNRTFCRRDTGRPEGESCKGGQPLGHGE